MSKRYTVKYLQRDPVTGKYAVKIGGKTVAKKKGAWVRASGPSIRRAKTLAKNLLRYNDNVGFIVQNDRKESESAISVGTKSRLSLENKYKNVTIK